MQPLQLEDVETDAEVWDWACEQGLTWYPTCVKGPLAYSSAGPPGLF